MNTKPTKKTCQGCLRLKLYNAEWRKIGRRKVCPACVEMIEAGNKAARQRAIYHQQGFMRGNL